MSEQINSDNLAKNVGNKAKEILGKSTQVLSNKLASYGLPVAKIAMQREKAMIWVSNNKWRVITGLLISLLIIFYFVAIYNRIPRYLARMEVYDINVAGLSAKNEIMNNNYCLGDFWIASSYKSYLPCTNYTDYASIDSITHCLKYGARLIDLDIFNSGIFDTCPDPVVCNGKEAGNWHYTNELLFDDVCREISMFAFNPRKCGNSSDPLFLSLNFKTWGNKNTIDKAATILKKHFSESRRLLCQTNAKYAFQGRRHLPNGLNIAAEPIKNLINKVVIICTGNIKNTEMDELCQLYGISPDIVDKDRPKYRISDSNEHNFEMKIKTHLQIENYGFSEAKELKNFNKGAAGTNGITKVIPDFKTRSKQNYNCWIPFYYACTFICMNYNEPTDFMMSYVQRFKNCSFLLKPYRLRYHKTCIYPPKEQDQSVSFAPRRQTIAAGYTMEY